MALSLWPPKSNFKKIKMDFSLLTTSDFFGVLFVFFIFIFITFSLFAGFKVFKTPFENKE
jgi:hypothetical protein